MEAVRTDSRGTDAGNPTLASAFRTAARTWGDRTAIWASSGGLTFTELETASDGLAEVYVRMGLRPGDRVLCQLSNRPELLIALAAAWKSGLVHVGVDHRFTTPELSWLIAHTEAAALIVEPAAPPWASVKDLHRLYPTLISFSVGYPTAADGLQVFEAPTRASTAGHRARTVDFAQPAPGAPAVIFVTSGTTGLPKTALGFQGNLAQRWSWIARELRFSPVDVHLGHMPLTHGFGLMMAVMALMTGGSLVLMPQFTAAAAVDLIDRARVSVLHGSPTHFRLIINYLKQEERGIGGLRIGVGSTAAFPPSLLEAIFTQLRMDFMLMYGASEGVGIVTTDKGDMMLGAVGRPAPGSVGILNAEGNLVGANQLGEIAFSLDFFPVQYWKQERSGSWYRSGDLGRLDDEGRVYVLGKLKHQISRGGLNIDPVEVEIALHECQGVADAAVVGRPNPILGETVCACVVPIGSLVLDLAAVRTQLEARLAEYKLPDELLILKQIPRTPLGKVDLQKLRTLVGDGNRAEPDAPPPAAGATWEKRRRR